VWWTAPNFFGAARNHIVESASAIAYVLRLLGGSPGERSMEDVSAILAAGAATYSRLQSVSSFEDYLGLAERLVQSIMTAAPASAPVRTETAFLNRNLGDALSQ
jgi:hypothetical protein